MRIEQLRYAIETEAQKSISSAAKSLYISQSSLSKAIAGLEEELGSPIFIRNRNGVSATAFGIQVLRLAEKAVEQFDRITALSNELTEKKVRFIRVLSIHLFYDKMMGEALIFTKQAYPNVEILISNATNEEIIDQVASDGNDAFAGFLGMYSSFYSEYYHELIQAKKLEFTPLFTNEICAFMHKDNPLVKKQVLTRKDLAQETLATYNPFMYKETMDKSDFATVKSHTKSKMYLLTSLDQVQNLILSNAAIATLPRMTLIDSVYVKMGHIRAIPIEDMDSHLIAGIIHKQNHTFSLPEKRFIGYMDKLIRKYI